MAETMALSFANERKHEKNRRKCGAFEQKLLQEKWFPLVFLSDIYNKDVASLSQLRKLKCPKHKDVEHCETTLAHAHCYRTVQRCMTNNQPMPKKTVRKNSFIEFIVLMKYLFHLLVQSILEPRSLI